MASWWWVVFLLGLTAVTGIIIQNTNQYPVIRDANRYIQRFNINMNTEQFVFMSNLFIFTLIGLLVLIATDGNHIYTIVSLLGFSVSLLVYFSLLAQAAVVIIALALWIFVEDPAIAGFDEKRKLLDHAIFIIALIVCAFIQRFGWALILAVYFAKAFWPQLKQHAGKIAVIGYVCLGLILLAQVFPSPERVSFFYYFLLPVSLGSLDVFYWYGLFGVVLFLLFKCKDNTKELLIAGLSFFAAVIFFQVSHLEIDVWRMLVFFEVVTWIKIAQHIKLTDYFDLPILFLLIEVERLIVGLLV